MRKFVCISLLIAVLATSAFFLVACNSDDHVVSTGEFLKDVANVVKMPDFASLFTADDNAAITKGVEEAAKATDDATRDEEAIKDAVMLLYNTANTSRLNNEKGKKGTSLMVQRSLGGNAQGRVYMNGFTLQSGGKWYYQLASQAAKGDVAGFETIARIMSPIAGNLQVAYTLDSQKYMYAYIMGTATQMDCSSNVFPYATFTIPKGEEPKEYDGFEAYQADRNCRDGQLELNNMRIYRDLLKDCQISYDAQKQCYNVKFAIECEDGDKEHINDFQAKSRLDLDIGVKSFTINNTISGWHAELEVYKNGYARAFRSYEDWQMIVKVIGMNVPVESHPSNEFVYAWNNKEILKIIGEDSRIETTLRTSTLAHHPDDVKIEKCIDYYANIAQNGSVFVFDYFTFTLALVGSVVGAMIIVAIVLTILFKKGKLPKLQAAIERDKARRKAISAQNKEDKEEKKELKAEKKEERAERKAEKYAEDNQSESVEAQNSEQDSHLE